MLVGLRGASQQASGIKSKTFSFWAGCHYSESAAREEFASLVQERAVVCSLFFFTFLVDLYVFEWNQCKLRGWARTRGHGAMSLNSEQTVDCQCIRDRAAVCASAACLFLLVD